jgi:hypothetical protein
LDDEPTASDFDFRSSNSLVILLISAEALFTALIANSTEFMRRGGSDWGMEWWSGGLSGKGIHRRGAESAEDGGGNHGMHEMHERFGVRGS